MELQHDACLGILQRRRELSAGAWPLSSRQNRSRQMKLIISAQFVGLILFLLDAEEKTSVTMCEQRIRDESTFPANECIRIHPISFGF